MASVLVCVWFRSGWRRCRRSLGSSCNVFLAPRLPQLGCGETQSFQSHRTKKEHCKVKMSILLTDRKSQSSGAYGFLDNRLLGRGDWNRLPENVHGTWLWAQRPKREGGGLGRDTPRWNGRANQSRNVDEKSTPRNHAKLSKSAELRLPASWVCRHKMSISGLSMQIFT